MVCGAPILKGGLCTRKTKNDQKCWQHKGGSHHMNPMVRRWKRQFHRAYKKFHPGYHGKKSWTLEKMRKMRSWSPEIWKKKASMAKNIVRLKRHGIDDPYGVAQEEIRARGGNPTSIKALHAELRRIRKDTMGSHKRSGYHRRSKGSRKRPKHIRFE